MTHSWPQFQNMPQDGQLWMLTWLGPYSLNITTSSQRVVLAALSCVKNSKDRTPNQIFGRSPPRPDQLGQQRLVEFPVGELPMLTIGTFFRNGRALNVGIGTLKQRTFTVDFSKQRLFRLDKIPGGEPGHVLSKEDCLLSGAWAPMAHSACVGLAQKGDSFAVGVPVAEVLRWCYGSSSRMLQTVLSMDLPKVIKQVKRTMVRTASVLDIQLPEGFVEQDAVTLGWLASTPEAFDEACRVNRSVLAYASQPGGGRGPSHPNVSFPYRETLELRVLGREIAHEETPRFLVHRILGTSLNIPFTVRLPVSTFNHVPPEPGSPLPAPRGKRKGRARAKTALLGTKTEPRRQGSAALLPALESQFSNMDISHREIPAGDATPVQSYALPAPTGLLSTGLGEDRSSTANKVILTLLKSPKPVPDEPVQNDAFTRLRMVFDQLRNAGVTIREVPLNNQGGQEARFTHWTYSDGTRVACLVAAAERQHQFWYVFEQQRQVDEYGPLLLAQRPSGRSASISDLDDLLLQAEGPNTWPRKHGDWTLLHVRHGFRSVEAFTKGLQQRMGWTLPVIP
ncbi:hypothetical protein Q0M94_14340 [Deinococcus radiomollis]|uniref:hypothetical protein n=1 Tax=Deinococcus radiomollis TaxID=468916 RepID=UPI003891F13E